MSGELSVGPPRRAAAQVELSECVESWSPRGAGVELRDDRGWSFDFRHDSVSGPSLQVSDHRGQAIAMLTPADCERFSGHLRRHTELDEQRVHVTSGFLELSCRHDDGVRLEGALTFHRCVQR